MITKILNSSNQILLEFYDMERNEGAQDIGNTPCKSRIIE